MSDKVLGLCVFYFEASLGTKRRELELPLLDFSGITKQLPIIRHLNRLNK